MRRGFVVGVLVFGFVAATAITAAIGADLPWPKALRTWALIFGALALLPLGINFWAGLFGWILPRGDATEHRPRG